MKRLVLLLLLFTTVPILSQDDDFRTPRELADPNGKFAMIDNAEIYFIEEGDSSQPAVILMHGFGGSTFTWRDTLPALADAGLYAVALDLPPFGLSDKGPDLDYSRAWMADLIAGLMDDLDIETATIVGHSMGGHVTAHFAVRHSERVDKLVFVAGGIFNEQASDNSEEEQENGNSLFSLMSQLDPESPIAALTIRTLLTPERFTDILTSAYHRTEVVTDEVAEGYQRGLSIENWELGFLAYTAAEETDTVTLDDLVNAVDVPVLILWGEEDTWVPIEGGIAMAVALPTAMMITYPDVGHLPMEENVDPFNTDLIAFLQS